MYSTDRLNKRSGYTLIELLVVIAIVTVLLAVLLPAVQRVRLAAWKMSASNSMKQFLLGTHHYCDAHENKMPEVGYDRNHPRETALTSLFPYLEATQTRPPRWTRFQSDPTLSWYNINDVSEDQGLNPIPDQHVTSSIALNPYCYSKFIAFPATISDGTSQTIAMTEHYGFCNGANYRWDRSYSECLEFPSMKRIPCPSDMDRRATFADITQHVDVYPQTTLTNLGPSTVGSEPVTFQVRPPRDECNPRIPQSTFPGGLLCGVMDGSVRFVSAGVSIATFWGAVTPSGGEVQGDDW